MTDTRAPTRSGSWATVADILVAGAHRLAAAGELDRLLGELERLRAPLPFSPSSHTDPLLSVPCRPVVCGGAIACVFSQIIYEPELP